VAMHAGKLVFSQVSEHLPRTVFIQCVERYAGNYPTRSFSHWDQLLCMMFAQLTSRASLRDVTVCLQSHSSKLYRAGFRGNIARSTLADANEQRDCTIFADFALHLIGLARSLYAKDDTLCIQLAQTVYAIDSTLIDLCLSLFAWAPSANSRAGVKVHTALDLRGNIPAFIRITHARESDASFLDHLPLEAGSFYVMDRAYVHFARLIRLSLAAAFFVVRCKSNLQYRVEHSEQVVQGTGVLSDQYIFLTGRYTKGDYALWLRRVEFHDAKHERRLIFLTNNFELPALQIALLYKSRWQVELFFKWIKQNLRIKSFLGNSANAVKTQIWIAISTYVLVAIIKKRLQIDASMHSILQVLSVNLFEKKSLAHLLPQVDEEAERAASNAQMTLFEKVTGQ
jgi:hypothetical protein